ncbi:FAD binding domain-containing protein [Rhodocaloribacter sp.]
MAEEIHFILNDEDVHTSAPSGMLALDFLRRRARLTGTKEGCREGDCGACVVLVGVLEGGAVRYEPVTSCLLPLGELHGRHLVTIEGLGGEKLTPVQSAIVDEGATQCGFCTPGIVVSMTGMLMEAGAPVDRERVKTALSGHLCRCTGYRSLKAAGDRIAGAVGDRTGVEALVAGGWLPAYFRGIPARLAAIPAPVHGNGAMEPIPIAGGTDLYVQRGDALPEAPVRMLNRSAEWKGVAREAGFLRVGALTSFEAFARSPEVRETLPRIGAYMRLIASWQIRNRATLGGNVVNASPIGDLSILLIALDARLVLRNGASSRTVPIRTFYRGYKTLDKAPGEMLTEILIPTLEDAVFVNWEKVSKRKHLDIASVNGAMRVRVEDGVITEMGLACGGVAPVPLFLKETSRYFLGKPVTVPVVQGAFPVLQAEIAPITDVRGSAAYKRLLARQILIAHFARLFPEVITARAFYEKR